MAKVKVLPGIGETLEQAEDALIKAMTSQATGDVHQESFQDPAMAHTANKMEQSFKKIYQEMINEISDVLDKDYNK